MTDNQSTNILDVGKYAGKDIASLPTEYLRWAIGNLVGVDDATVKAMMDEFEKRKGVYEFENADGDRRTDINRNQLKKADLASLQKAWQMCREEFTKALGKELPFCTLAMRTNKRILGTWYPLQRLMTISNYWILPREVLQSVIVHEMCHQWITDMGIHDNGAHGREWLRVANIMNNQTGLKITKTTNPVGFKANPQRRAEPNIIYFY